MRDNKWLADLLFRLHAEYYADVPIMNLVLVRFARASKTRLGSIIARPRKGHKEMVTTITINELFRNEEEVPEYVIIATLLHEFAHYAHGFHSPLPQKYRYPHRGGIVNKEIRARGGGEILKQQESWIKNSYKPFLRSKRLI